MKIKGNKLVVLASTLIIMMGCENDLTEVREMAGKNTNTEVGTQIDSYLSLEGKMKAHLTAPTIIRYVAEGPKRSEFPKSLHVDFFNDSNKIESRIDAQYGNYIENEKKVLLKKNVVATNIYGDTLQTDELWWDQNAEKFYTDKKVIFSKNYRNDYFIGLKGMTCNENLTDLRLFEIEDKSFFIYKDSSAQSTPAPPPVLQQRKK